MVQTTTDTAAVAVEHVPMAAGSAAPQSDDEVYKQMEKMEAIRLGYDKAIDAWIGVTDEVWTRFNALLLSNSLLIAVGFGTLSADRSLPVLSGITAIVGLVLAALWFGMLARGFSYLHFYIQAARELEERYLGPEVHTVSGGWDLLNHPNGARITLRARKTGGNGEPLIVPGEVTYRMSWLGRWLPNKVAMYVIVGLFAVLYVVLLLGAIGVVSLGQ